MGIELKDWKEPDHGSGESESKPFKTGEIGEAGLEEPLDEKGIWVNPDLVKREETANLDSQDPATLYYLGRVVDVPEIVQIYVEKHNTGSVKHWAVLEERDYDVMERIYEIEEDTLDRFPMADLNFRVTVFTDGGPSITKNANKVYDST